MLSSQAFLAFSILLFAGFMPSYSSAQMALDTGTLLKKMEASYAGVKDYQAGVEERTYNKDGSFETKKFLYTFKKPGCIRLDFVTPHSGRVLVYPDKNGEVAIRPSGFPFFKLHLALNHPLLKVTSGQRLDQTDLGLLIKNIVHSLTDQRRGPVEVEEEDGYIRVQVLADSHFQKGVETLYRFLIDQKLWLPVQVEESTPGGRLERKIVFHNLRTNISVLDSFFRLDG
jgi:outer membrane lipoprotein-sorting protein